MSPRLVPSVRLLYGCALLLEPSAALGDVTGPPVDERARVVGRILGVRQIAQAVLVPGGASRGRKLTGVAVDAAHGATMVALAVLDPTRRRLAGINAVAAGAFALAGLRQARRS